MGFNNIKINTTRVGAPKVLIVGRGDGEQNQFVKKIEALGCEVDTLTGDPGPVPDTYDACVLLKNTISHQKFWQTKEVYSGKNLFVTSSGFSPIKEALQQFVFNFKPPAKDLGAAIEDSFRGVQIVPKIDSQPPSAYYKPTDSTADVDARFARALGHVQKPPLPVFKSPYESSKVEVKKEIATLLPIRDTKRGDQLITDCIMSGMTPAETIDMLKAENLVRTNGREFSRQDIASTKFKLNKQGLLKKADATDKEEELTSYDMDPNTIVESAPVELVVKGEGLKRVDFSIQRAGMSINDLLTAVLTGTHTMERKLELIAEINAGKITKSSGISTEIVNGEIGITRFDLNNAESNQSFFLNVSEATLIVDASAEILDFVMANRGK